MTLKTWHERHGRGKSIIHTILSRLCRTETLVKCKNNLSRDPTIIE